MERVEPDEALAHVQQPLCDAHHECVVAVLAVLRELPEESSDPTVVRARTQKAKTDDGRLRNLGIAIVAQATHLIHD